LRKKYPEGNIDITLRELLKYTVAESDNNGCDILFRIMGGPAKVNQYISNLGIKGMSIAATEEEMHQEWSVQYKNYSTPFAMVNLLYKFSRDSILSAPSKKFLWNIMTQNIFGSKRISGQLPAGTIVAQKTGTSDVNNGIAAATNDAGVVTLPNGRQFAIVAFIADSPDNEITRDKIIADIAKAVWNAYLNN
jgi:beta-lactamase class A